MNNIFTSLGSEHHIKILGILNEHKELPPFKICLFFNMEQSTMSHHLNLMRRRGILKTRLKGRMRLYSINYDTMRSFFNDFFNTELGQEFVFYKKINKS